MILVSWEQIQVIYYKPNTGGVGQSGPVNKCPDGEKARIRRSGTVNSGRVGDSAEGELYCDWRVVDFNKGQKAPPVPDGMYCVINNTVSVLVIHSVEIHRMPL